jgi:hypothetical protein
MLKNQTSIIFQMTNKSTEIKVSKEVRFQSEPLDDDGSLAVAISCHVGTK